MNHKIKEEFHQIGGYNNYLSGESDPEDDCDGELSGKIENMSISGLVAGRALSLSDFIIGDDSTVENLTFNDDITDPNEIDRANFVKYEDKNAYEGYGGVEIDDSGVNVLSYLQCLDRCLSDWSCECVVFNNEDLECFKRANCEVSEFDDGGGYYDVYVRQWQSS